MNVEFELRLKEYASGVLKGFQNTTRSVFGDVDNRVKRTQRGLSDLGRSVKLNVDSSGISRAERDIERLSNKMNNIGGGGLGIGGVAIGSLMARGVEMAGRSVVDFGKQALDAGMDAEQQIIGLTTFLGKGKAKALYEKIQKDSALTPFTTSQIMPGLIPLMSAGQTPEKAQKDIWGLMNALSAVGHAGDPFMLGLMESHMGQMAASGRADARFVNEFQRTGSIPIFDLLATEVLPKMNHKAGMKQIAEWSDNGELKDHVSYDQFTAALNHAGEAGGKFAGALEAQSQSIKGKSSTIKDFWNIGMAKMVLDPQTHANITRLEDRLIAGLSDFPGMIGKLSPVINRVFDSFDEVWPAISKFGSGILDVLKPLGGLLLSDGVKKLITNILSLSSAILNSPLLQKGMGVVKEVGEGVAGTIGREANTYRNWWNYFANHEQYERDNDPRVMTSERKGYYWGTAPIGTPRGSVIDSAAVKHITDSLGVNNIFNNQKDAKEWDDKFMKKYYPKTAFDVQALPLPMTTDKLMKGKKWTDPGASGETNDSILGGGRKQIIINVKSFAEHFTVHAGSLKDAGAQTKEVFERMFLEVLQSANAAM